MTSGKRVLNILLGFMMILFSGILIADSERGYVIVILILDITLLAAGVRELVYYFSLARFMVGGIKTFYGGIIMLDLGLFVFNLDETPKAFAMIYLIGCLAFAGVQDVLSAMDAKRLESGSWKYKLTYGMIKVVMAAVCLLFLHTIQILTWIYAASLIHSGISHIVTACRKTAIVYIE